MAKLLFKDKLYFNRSKEDNWDYEEKLVEFGIDKKRARDIVYLGYEVEIEVEFYDDLSVKVVGFEGKDILDKEIIWRH